jgi:hypothetical protein
MSPFDMRITIIGGYALNNDENYMAEDGFYNGLNTVLFNTGNTMEIIMPGALNGRMAAQLV